MTFGIREAAWPWIRDDVGLSYAAIGVLLTVPTLVSGALEPVLALVSAGPRRSSMIAAGGCAFAAALALVAGASTFALLLVGFAVLYPASGAFVSLTQAALMDSDPARHEHNMARWVLAGSVGVVVGPLLVAGAVSGGLGWRPLLLACALVALPLAVRARRIPITPTEGPSGLGAGVRASLAALRKGSVVRWLAILEMTNLLGDVFAGFLALYFVDVVHARVEGAALAVVVWTVTGLAGDALLVPLLHRVSGVAYLRLSGVAMLGVFPALLLVPSLPLKFVLLGMVGLLHAGWYAIPQARLYSDLSDSANVAVALTNVGGLVGGAFPLLLGLAAERWGLLTAVWLCGLAPVALLIGLAPGRRRQD